MTTDNPEPTMNLNTYVRCIECGQSENIGYYLKNGPEYPVMFKYMDRGQGACLECYIDRAVRMSLAENLSKLK